LHSVPRRNSSITVRIPQAMKEAMQRVAEGERRNLSQMIGVVLEQFLESRHEWPPEPTRTAARKTRPATRRG
jgi:Arc/MetJ-type ribon-helix-helix transcriptional regulator